MVGKNVEKPSQVSNSHTTEQNEDLAPTVKHRIDTKLRNAECPHLPVLKRTVHITLAELPTRLRISIFPLMPHPHQRLLLLRQKIRRLRIIRKEEVRHNTKQTTRNALNDHNPPPPGHTLQAFHVPNPIRQESTQRTRDGSADEEIPDAQRQLVLGVEEGEVDVEAGEETGLDGAQEQTACEECAVRVDQAGERRDQTPGEGDEGDPAARGEELED